jgi:DNA-binding IclR family transcriptional regulator
MKNTRYPERYIYDYAPSTNKTLPREIVHQVWTLIADNPKLSTWQISRKIGCSRSRVGVIMQYLKEHGFLTYERGREGTCFILPPKYELKANYFEEAFDATLSAE